MFTTHTASNLNIQIPPTYVGLTLRSAAGDVFHNRLAFNIRVLISFTLLMFNSNSEKGESST